LCFSRAAILAVYSAKILNPSSGELKSFYDNSQGGVTFSGGEPLLQKDFLLAVAKACREEGIHTAMETCGHIGWEVFEELLPHLNLVYFDFKHIYPVVHKEQTGVSNELILENLVKIGSAFHPLIVRIPVIPGYNDCLEVQREMYRFLKQNLKKLETVELLPFHRLGSGKYKGLGRQYSMENVPSLNRDRSPDCHRKYLKEPLGCGTYQLQRIDRKLSATV